MGRNYRCCAVPGCLDTQSTRHRFPNPNNDRKRYNIWVQIIRNPTVATLDPQRVYANYRVCHQHFKASDKSSNMFLVRTAVPTQKLPPTTGSKAFASSAAASTASASIASDCESTSKVQVMEEELFNPKTNELASTMQEIQHNPKMNYTNGQISEKYKTLAVSSPKQFVYVVHLNRPEKLNSMNGIMWKEFENCFNELAVEPDCRVIILSGAGKAFCAGIDVQGIMNLAPRLAESEDVARRCKILHSTIKDYQNSFTAIEKCPKPVIAAVHGACIGAGIDMISAVDIRYCSSGAWFQIKEVDLGMAADVGTLQRFPKVIGSDSLVRELVYTARKFTAAEALQHGFVSRLFDDQESLLKCSMELAEEIARKSPVAIQGSKLSLNYSRDHSVQDGLDHIAMYNQTMLQSEDFINAAMSLAAKSDPPVFSKL